MSSSCYDTIIVGGGIAGLRIGIHILKKYPKQKCCILEKYFYFGGRVVTFKKQLPSIGHIQWENGAGRISTSHKKVLQLLKKYNLTFIPISGESNYLVPRCEMISNPFSKLLEVYLEPLKNLSKEILQTHTIGELLNTILGYKKAKEFYSTFPYYAEIHTLRADLALHSFETEMSSNNGFGVCAEGLSSLIDCMVNEFHNLGGILLSGIELKKISYNNKIHNLECFESCTKQIRHFQSTLSILALHSNALSSIQGVKHLPVLSKLKMEPLLRIYAVFPVNRGKSWFSDLSKIVTPHPIRYIIPIQPSKGIDRKSVV